LAHLHKASAGTHPRYESRVSKSFSAIRTQTIKMLKATKFTHYLNLNSNKNIKIFVSDEEKKNFKIFNLSKSLSERLA
jgi:putative heme iron utilization protein